MVDIIKKIPLKYIIWGLAASISIILGYWSGYFKSARIDFAYFNLNIPNFIQAISSEWVILFHLIITYLFCLENEANRVLKKRADEATDALNRKLLSVAGDANESEFRNFLTQLSKENVVINWDALKDRAGIESAIKECDRLLEKPESETDLIAFNNDNEKDVIRGAKMFFGILLIKTDESLESEILTLSENTKDAQIRHEEATSYTKAQYALGCLTSLLFLILIVFLIYKSNWSQLAPIGVGIFLGWLLGQAERMKGLSDKAYFPYLIALALGGCGYYYGDKDGNIVMESAQSAQIQTGDGITVDGKVLYVDSSNIILANEIGQRVYLPQSEVRKIVE